MQLHYLLVIVVSDVIVMSSTVAVIFAITWVVNNCNIRIEPSLFEPNRIWFFYKKKTKPNRNLKNVFHTSLVTTSGWYYFLSVCDMCSRGSGSAFPVRSVEHVGCRVNDVSLRVVTTCFISVVVRVICVVMATVWRFPWELWMKTMTICWVSGNVGPRKVKLMRLLRVSSSSRFGQSQPSVGFAAV